ncbi:hypothetical protein [Pseudoduganella violaceinigra]|uniref:hypothetical protein n=1 Tax=Pseudoduganella violaceinigra TaxID=246602 RepID=UPI0004867986|nr:hypothetical protein [Pseudoduganella violaceinigra]
MIQFFARPNELADSFSRSVTIGLIAIILMGAVVLLAAWSRRRKWYLKPAMAMGFIGLFLVAWGAYSATYARFIEAEVRSSGLRLRFAGPFAKDLTVAPDAVADVLFGTPGKSHRQCYIRISLKSGASYSSPPLAMELEQCKALRRKLAQALEEAVGPKN